ncbi:hypothetical protein X798_00698, partial [Onchocerca flexuosa]
LNKCCHVASKIAHLQSVDKITIFVELIIKEKCCDSFSSAYAFTADPNEVNHKFYTIKVVLTITCAMDTLMKRNTGLKEKVYIEVKEMKCFKN